MFIFKEWLKTKLEEDSMDSESKTPKAGQFVILRRHSFEREGKRHNWHPSMEECVGTLARISKVRNDYEYVWVDTNNWEWRIEDAEIFDDFTRLKKALIGRYITLQRHSSNEAWNPLMKKDIGKTVRINQVTTRGTEVVVRSEESCTQGGVPWYWDLKDQIIHEEGFSPSKKEETPEKLSIEELQIILSQLNLWNKLEECFLFFYGPYRKNLQEDAVSLGLLTKGKQPGKIKNSREVREKVSSLLSKSLYEDILSGSHEEELTVEDLERLEKELLTLPDKQVTVKKGSLLHRGIRSGLILITQVESKISSSQGDSWTVKQIGKETALELVDKKRRELSLEKRGINLSEIDTLRRVEERLKSLPQKKAAEIYFRTDGSFDFALKKSLIVGIVKPVLGKWNHLLITDMEQSLKNVRERISRMESSSEESKLEEKMNSSIEKEEELTVEDLAELYGQLSSKRLDNSIQFIKGSLFDKADHLGLLQFTSKQVKGENITGILDRMESVLRIKDAQLRLLRRENPIQRYDIRSLQRAYSNIKSNNPATVISFGENHELAKLLGLQLLHGKVEKRGLMISLSKIDKEKTLDCLQKAINLEEQLEKQSLFLNAEKESWELEDLQSLKDFVTYFKKEDFLFVSLPPLRLKAFNQGILKGAKIPYNPHTCILDIKASIKSLDKEIAAAKIARNTKTIEEGKKKRETSILSSQELLLLLSKVERKGTFEEDVPDEVLQKANLLDLLQYDTLPNGDPQVNYLRSTKNLFLARRELGTKGFFFPRMSKEKVKEIRDYIASGATEVEYSPGSDTEKLFDSGYICGIKRDIPFFKDSQIELNREETLRQLEILLDQPDPESVENLTSDQSPFSIDELKYIKSKIEHKGRSIIILLTRSDLSMRALSKGLLVGELAGYLNLIFVDVDSTLQNLEEQIKVQEEQERQKKERERKEALSKISADDLIMLGNDILAESEFDEIVSFFGPDRVLENTFAADILALDSPAIDNVYEIVVEESLRRIEEELKERGRSIPWRESEEESPKEEIPQEKKEIEKMTNRKTDEEILEEIVEYVQEFTIRDWQWIPRERVAERWGISDARADDLLSEGSRIGRLALDEDGQIIVPRTKKLYDLKRRTAQERTEVLEEAIPDNTFEEILKETKKSEVSPSVGRGIMSGNRMLEALKSTGRDALESGRTGGRMAASKEFMDGIVTIAKETLPDEVSMFLDTELGEKVAPALLSLLVNFSTHAVPQYIPHSKVVRDISKSAMDACAYENAKDLTSLLQPFFQRVGQMAASITLSQQELAEEDTEDD